MDPVGPWTAAYAASYNRLAGVPGGFQPAAGGGGDYPHHNPAVPSTSSQLLLHAHTTSSIAGLPTGSGSAFNPSGFLSPPPVGYDPSVFSPYLHHANQKSHYSHALSAHQHRQAMANSKTPEPGIYNSAHQPITLTPVYFDQTSSAQPPSITWSQNKATLPSPFGVLPHESVVGSSPGGSPTSAYENFNPAHFATAHHMNSIAANYGDGKHLVTRQLHSPPLKTIAPSITSSTTYFQQTSPTGYTRSENASNQYSITKAHSASLLGRQPQNSLTNPNLPQSLVRSPIDDFSRKSQDKTSVTAFQSTATIQPDRRESTVESSQSSPISYALMDSIHHRPSVNIPSIPGNVQHAQLQQSTAHQKASAYRAYPLSTGTTPESEYSKSSVNRKTSTDGGYSSGSSVGQSSGDCGTMQQNHLSHSQPSPVGHITSPVAYPMYHSPMTSMSSPSPVQQLSEQNLIYKQHPSPQLAPTSPLDVSVAKPVALVHSSSVITRNDQNYTNNRGVEFSQKGWEAVEKQQMRGHGISYPLYPGEEPQDMNALPGSNQRPLTGLTERQQAYFDTNSPVQCSMINNKGDPMSIVKNLHTAQQQCQPPPIQTDITKNNVAAENNKPISKGSSSRRKRSSDSKTQKNDTGSKALNSNTNKTPPPAHLNQDHQSSGYSDWDAPHKAMPDLDNLVPTPHDADTNDQAPNATATQAVPNLPAQQSEGSLPLPEFADAANTRLTGRETVNNVLAAPKIDIPTVIVPDIEEELAFLADPPKLVPKSNLDLDKKRKSEPPVVFKTNPNASYLNTFLNFINGKREKSPPPKPLSNRVTPVKPYVPPVKQEKTGENIKPKSRQSKVKSPSPCYNFEDDPRYFPLPKDSSNRRLDSSSDSELDYDNVIPKMMYDPSKVECKEPAMKSDKKQTVKKSKGKQSKNSRSKKRKHSSDEDEEEEDKPKQIKSKQRAKRKTKKVFYDDDEDSDLLDFSSSDSDSDPAWKPSERKASDESRRRSQRFNSKPPVKHQNPTKGKVKTPSRFLPSSGDEIHGSEIEDDPSTICSGCDTEFSNPKDSIMCCECRKNFHSGCSGIGTLQRLQKLGVKRKKWKCSDCKPLAELSTNGSKKPLKKKPKKTEIKKEKTSSSKALSLEEESSNSLGPEEFFPFKSGDFLVVKSELVNEYPPIWRVDGKTLLQKYEPFDQNGEKLYKNISTYSGWTPQNKEIYEKIPIQFVMQSRFDTIVKFLRSEMVDPEQEKAFLNHSLSEMSKFQDNFEVYIQTLISQALDSNFLAEILAEKDEYFLQNVDVIDRITIERRGRLVAALDWPADAPIQRSLTTWPCYNVLADLKVTAKLCDACGRNKVHARMLLYGQPYNGATLDGAAPNTTQGQKDFLICLDCIKWVQLFNKLVHQKYIMYIECAKRVAERRAHDSSKETTTVLNELLADEIWLNKLFRQVRVTWADVEKAEREKNRELGIAVKSPSVSISSLPVLPVENSTGNPDSEVKIKDKREDSQERDSKLAHANSDNNKIGENEQAKENQGDSEKMETEGVGKVPCAEEKSNEKDLSIKSAEQDPIKNVDCTKDLKNELRKENTNENGDLQDDPSRESTEINYDKQNVEVDQPSEKLSERKT